MLMFPPSLLFAICHPSLFFLCSLPPLPLFSNANYVMICIREKNSSGFLEIHLLYLAGFPRRAGEDGERGQREGFRKISLDVDDIFASCRVLQQTRILNILGKFYSTLLLIFSHPSFFIIHPYPSSFIFSHPLSFNTHPSPFIIHSSFFIFILHPSSFILQFSLFILHPFSFMLYQSYFSSLIFHPSVLILQPPSSFILHPSSFILHLSSFILHPSSFILHPSSFILHPSSFILQSSSFMLHASFFILNPSSFIISEKY